MDYGLAIAFYNWLPNHYYREHATTARLGYAVETVFGAKHDSFDDFLEPWMRPDTGGPKVAKVAVFTRDAVESVDLLYDLGLLSQAALVAFGPKRLRESGAFAAGRVTDTTMGG